MPATVLAPPPPPPADATATVTTLLHTVFARFVKAAEAKLNTTLYLRLDREVDLAAPFRRRADPAFDRLLDAMGAVSKHAPKLLIDSVVVWRKSRTDSAANDYNPAMWVFLFVWLAPRLPAPETDATLCRRAGKPACVYQRA